MAADFQIKYPSADTIALTFTSIVSLANDGNALAGASSAVVDNTTNLDVDHEVSGKIVVGSSPQGGAEIQVWAYVPHKIVSGTYGYPDTLDGTDSTKTLTSLNVKNAALIQIASIMVDSTSSRAYWFRPTSIAGLLGFMPKKWGLFVVNSTNAALAASGHEFYYDRQRGQQTP